MTVLGHELRTEQARAIQVTLPTEAQWEYACRARSTTAYSFGDDASKLGDCAWYVGSAWDKDEKYPHPVGQKKPNAFGLYDMYGNVSEWCRDWYDEEFYVNARDVDPENTVKGRFRVLRGGAFGTTGSHCRSAHRLKSEGTETAIGFRVVVLSGSGMDAAKQVVDPVFSPTGRKISGPTGVRVSCDTPGADIRYTIDGTEPRLSSRRCTGVVNVQPGTTLRARAFRRGFKPSGIVEAEYKQERGPPQDIVKIRSGAKAAWKAAQGYDRGQGFEAKMQYCSKLIDQAHELYKKEAFAAAKTPYKRVVFLCKELKRLDGTRKIAENARDRAGAAIKTVPDFGTLEKPNEAWKPVAVMARRAMTLFQRGEFAKACGLWEKVIGQIERR